MNKILLLLLIITNYSCNTIFILNKDYVRKGRPVPNARTLILNFKNDSICTFKDFCVSNGVSDLELTRTCKYRRTDWRILIFNNKDFTSSSDSAYFSSPNSKWYVDTKLPYEDTSELMIIHKTIFWLKPVVGSKTKAKESFGLKFK